MVMSSRQRSPRRAGRLLVLVLALVCVQAGSAHAAGGRALPAPAELRGPFAPGEAIVRFEQGASGSERRQARRAARVGYDGSLELPRAEVVEVDGSVAAAVRRLERQPGVAYAQPNYRYEALAVPAPNDTLFDQLWGLSDPVKPDPGVSALEAWETTLGSGQVIAVVDTGVDLTHPDIEGNLWENPAPDPIDEDLHGFDFVDGDGDPDDYEFHGTHVAGTAAAIAGNDEGIAGVAPEAEIMAVRVLDGDGSGFTSDIADGIAYAAEHGADVINLSLGGPAGGDEATEDAIELAAAKEAVVVAAAGNEGANNDVEPHTPCALPQSNLICVAALNRSGSLSSFSNYGADSVDLAAPGGGDVDGGGILSAKTDYGPPLFSDGFEAGLGLWTTQVFDGGVPWGLSSEAANGTESATDSPGGDYGAAPNPAATAASELFTTAKVNLTGERGCRLHFNTMYEIEPFFDGFYAGAISETSIFDGRVFDETSSGYPSSFSREEASVSQLDGRTDVHPIFAVLSDESDQRDGAYVDDSRLFCRDETYIDAIASRSQYDQPNVGNYVRFNGTSMAAPHVAGVVALVRAAAPALSAQQVIDAVLEGTSPIPVTSSSRPIATEGIADACQAIALATGGDVAADCPGSIEWEVIDSGGTVPPPLSVTETETPNPPSPAPPLVDGRPPTAFFRKRPPAVVRTEGRSVKAVFRLGADEPNVAFLCRFDAGPLRACGGRIARRFVVGQHVVRVKARDVAGNVGPFASWRFRVRRVSG